MTICLANGGPKKTGKWIRRFVCFFFNWTLRIPLKCLISVCSRLLAILHGKGGWSWECGKVGRGVIRVAKRLESWSCILSVFSKKNHLESQTHHTFSVLATFSMHLPNHALPWSGPASLSRGRWGECICRFEDLQHT